MARNGSGIYSKPAGTTATAGVTIESAKYNAVIDDLVTDANTPRPIVAGGTGASTASAARTALGLGTAAVANTGDFATAAQGAGALQAASDLSDLADAATARTNLGLGTAAVVDVIDEDDFATDSATRPPSQQSTKAYALSLRKVVQVVASQTGASSSTSNILPDDNTVPQNTEGAEFLSLAITPTSATNILQIDVVLFGSINNNRNLVVALFQDSTAGALAAASTYQGSTGELVTVTFRHRMTAGTTSATTFKVRAGAGASTATLTVNGKFGGVAASSITITELAT
jgi:hypothetical protein